MNKREYYIARATMKSLVASMAAIVNAVPGEHVIELTAMMLAWGAPAREAVERARGWTSVDTRVRLSVFAFSELIGGNTRKTRTARVAANVDKTLPMPTPVCVCTLFRFFSYISRSFDSRRLPPPPLRRLPSFVLRNPLPGGASPLRLTSMDIARLVLATMTAGHGRHYAIVESPCLLCMRMIRLVDERTEKEKKEHMDLLQVERDLGMMLDQRGDEASGGGGDENSNGLNVDGDTSAHKAGAAAAEAALSLTHRRLGGHAVEMHHIAPRLRPSARKKGSRLNHDEHPDAPPRPVVSSRDDGYAKVVLNAAEKSHATINGMLQSSGARARGIASNTTEVRARIAEEGASKAYLASLSSELNARVTAKVKLEKELMKAIAKELGTAGNRSEGTIKASRATDLNTTRLLDLAKQFQFDDELETNTIKQMLAERTVSEKARREAAYAVINSVKKELISRVENDGDGDGESVVDQFNMAVGLDESSDFSQSMRSGWTRGSKVSGSKLGAGSVIGGTTVSGRSGAARRGRAERKAAEAAANDARNAAIRTAQAEAKAAVRKELEPKKTVEQELMAAAREAVLDEREQVLANRPSMTRGARFYDAVASPRQMTFNIAVAAAKAEGTLSVVGAGTSAAPAPVNSPAGLSPSSGSTLAIAGPMVSPSAQARTTKALVPKLNLSATGAAGPADAASPAVKTLPSTSTFSTASLGAFAAAQSRPDSPSAGVSRSAALDAGATVPLPNSDAPLSPVPSAVASKMAAEPPPKPHTANTGFCSECDCYIRNALADQFGYKLASLVLDACVTVSSFTPLRPSMTNPPSPPPPPLTIYPPPPPPLSSVRRCHRRRWTKYAQQQSRSRPSRCTSQRRRRGQSAYNRPGGGSPSSASSRCSTRVPARRPKSQRQRPRETAPSRPHRSSACIARESTPFKRPRSGSFSTSTNPTARRHALSFPTTSGSRRSTTTRVVSPITTSRPANVSGCDRPCSRGTLLRAALCRTLHQKCLPTTTSANSPRTARKNRASKRLQFARAQRCACRRLVSRGMYRVLWQASTSALRAQKSFRGPCAWGRMKTWAGKRRGCGESKHSKKNTAPQRGKSSDLICPK